MYRPELDGRFYEIAMSFFIETGHTWSCVPEYINFNPNHISGVIMKRFDGLQFAAAEHCEQLSLLFMAHQCMFFSVELLTGSNQRSQVAYDFHELIHTFIESEASVCVFRSGNEVLFSFVGYGSRCILSDWFSLDDLYGELEERFDLSDVAIKSDFDYFCDLVYRLGRRYYCFHEENSVYALCPIDGIAKLERGICDSGELIEIIQKDANNVFNQYGEDYIEYDQSKRKSDFEIEYDFDMMIRAMDQENLFGGNTDFDDDESYVKKTLEELDEIDSSLHENVSRRGCPKKEEINGHEELVNEKAGKQPEYNPLFNPERSAAISRILSVLNQVERKLDFQEIKDISGIRDVDIVASALESLCRRGRVGRVWIRGRCKYVLRLRLMNELVDLGIIQK